VLDRIAVGLNGDDPPLAGGAMGTVSSMDDTLLAADFPRPPARTPFERLEFRLAIE